MARKKTPWWICNHCRTPVAPVQRGRLQAAFRAHRKVCSPTAGGFIEQIEQRRTTKKDI